jgi:hypothetical protein
MRKCGTWRALRWASASNAMMPPSPRLSARMMKSTYLIDTTMISDQNTRLSAPSTFAGVADTPCSPNTSFSVYSGLVPMSPKTTPTAPSANAAMRRDGLSVFIAVGLREWTRQPSRQGASPARLRARKGW